MQKNRVMLRGEAIERDIYLIRGHRVMFDRNLAALYGVATRSLNQAVKRNRERFPNDFMFQLNKEEFKDWKSQFVMSNSDKMGLRRPPYVFTEHGILMLSSVLNSPRAIEVNIAIMRIFIRIREMIITHKDFALRLEKLECAVEKQESHIHTIFEVIQQLTAAENKPKRRIGFIK